MADSGHSLVVAHAEELTRAGVPHDGAPAHVRRDPSTYCIRFAACARLHDDLQPAQPWNLTVPAGRRRDVSSGCVSLPIASSAAPTPIQVSSVAAWNHPKLRMEPVVASRVLRQVNCGATRRVARPRTQDVAALFFLFSLVTFTQRKGKLRRHAVCAPTWPDPARGFFFLSLQSSP